MELEVRVYLNILRTKQTTRRNDFKVVRDRIFKRRFRDTSDTCFYHAVRRTGEQRRMAFEKSKPIRRSLLYALDSAVDSDGVGGECANAVTTRKPCRRKNTRETGKKSLVKRQRFYFGGGEVQKRIREIFQNDEQSSRCTGGRQKPNAAQ